MFWLKKKISCLELWSYYYFIKLLGYSLQVEQVQEYDEGGVPKGAKTSDYYRTKDIPNRFENPGNS